MTKEGTPPRAWRGALAALAAIALYALLLDGFVEGWVRGSAMRWITTAVVILYGGASYALWNRTTWAQRAAFSAALLLALIAASAWRLGSASAPEGFTLLGQSALFGGLALLLGLGLGAGIVWRLPIRDHRIKIAASIVIAYAALPTAAGLAREIPLEGILLGQGFWEWPPFWLQGAWIGTAVLLPAAFVGALGLVFYDLVRGHLRRSTALIFQALALLLATLIATLSLQTQRLPNLASALGFDADRGIRRPPYPSSGGARARLTRAGHARPVYPEDLTAADLDGIADQMASGLGALAEESQQISRDSFDPQAIVDQVGREPEELFQWVRDRTYWVPYRGSLRGPIGVLMDRSGNSLDRSLLLAELLGLAGHEVRLARSQLEEEQGARLLSEIRPAPDQPLPDQPLDAKATQRRLQQLAEKHGLDAEEVERSARSAAKKTAELSEQLTARVAAQVPQLVELVGSRTDEQIERTRRQRQAVRLASIRDHWWVEHKQQDRWVPLDPLRPDAQPGDALADAPEILAAEGPGWPGTLDSEDHHEIEIRIVIERSQDGKLEQIQALSHTVRPSQLFGRSITFTHRPTSWPENLDVLNSRDPVEAFRSAALAQKEWIPVLWIGPSLHYENSVTDTGRTSPAMVHAGMLSVGGKQREGMDTVADALNNLFGDEPADEPTPGYLTAEWIEYELRIPGQQPRQIRRQIFDLVGPAKRAAGGPVSVTIDEAQRLERALALLGTSQILITAAKLSSPYVNHLAVSAMLENGRVLPELLRLAAGPVEKRSIELLNKLTPFPGQLYDFVLARQRLNPRDGEVCVCAPNVFSRHTVMRPAEDGGLSVRSGFDIVSNDVSAVSSSDSDSFAAVLTQGVLDTNAEAVLAGPTGCADGPAELLAGAEDVDWVTLRGPGDPELSRLSLPADVRARIEGDLADGYIAISPQSTASLGERSVAWWRIDPVTGRTLGIDERGHGSATAIEYIQLIKIELGLFATGFYGGYMGCRSLSPQSSGRACFACGVAIGLAMATFALNIPITAPLIFGGSAALFCGA